MPSTAATTKKGKTTGKKKSAEPIDLRTSPMWVSTTDLANSGCLVNADAYFALVEAALAMKE